MKPKTLDRIEEILSLSFGSRFDPGIVTMIDEVFGDEDDFIVESAINACIKSSPHPPTISDMHTEIANMRLERARDEETKRQKEIYTGPKPQSSAKAEFFKTNWKTEFKRLVDRREYIEKATKKHFKLDYLHKNLTTRRRHHNILVMARQIYLATKWDDKLTIEEISDGVMRSIKDRLDQEDDETIAEKVSH